MQKLALRHQGHIPWEWVDRQLQALRSLWVSTTRPDGRPHAVPVWFTWNECTLYFATHKSAQKAHNLEHQSWVVIHAGNGDDVLILEGITEVVSDLAELQQVDAARAAKYVDPKTGARDTILTDGTIVYRVALKHVMAWVYGDIATRTDWWPDPEGTNTGGR
jgi:nitroimidazol reductase NimA-like FMN-containing flavoprotein (pyridoxamine 5'-phosphate oxidase superfamily)